MGIHNPYLNRVAIKNSADFFGRSKEVTRIFSRIGASRPQSISIVGDRRIGKSSLLNHLNTPAIQKIFLDNSEDFIFVFMDLQQQRNLSLHNFLKGWLNQIQDAMNEKDFTIEGSFDGVRYVLETLQKNHLKLITLFDEFDVVTSNPLFSADFFAFLRSLANNYEVAYITSSGHDLQQLCHGDQIADSPFFNIFTNIYLRPFTPEEALTLITRPSLEAGIPLAKYAEDIQLLSGYFPFFLQMVCSNYFEHLQYNNEVIYSSIEEVFYDEAQTHFKYIWEHFNEENRIVCKSIAEQKTLTKEQTYIFEDLKRAGYVIDSNANVRLFSPRFVELAMRNSHLLTTNPEGSNNSKYNLHFADLPSTDPAITPLTLSRNISNKDESTAAQLAIPAQIDHFAIKERIGGGGMGEVFLAQDLELGRYVAIKTLKQRYASDNEIRLRFLREAQIASRLNHPYIGTIYEIGESNNIPYLVMEYIPGQTFTQRLKDTGPFQIQDIIRLGGQAAQALQEAHNNGVIHRDIKSSNLLIDKNGNLKILDFGLAKLGLFQNQSLDSSGNIATPKNITEPGILVGTVTYMSPEQAENKVEINFSTDIFSLGIVLYEITTGRLPFDGKTYFQIIEAITKSSPILIRYLRPEVPDKLEEIIMQALEKEVQSRFASSAEMVKAFLAI